VLLANYLNQLKAGPKPTTTGVAGEVITAGGANVKFSDFDTDKDGAIEVAEVPAALRALGIPDTDATAREVIKKADESGDSVVTVAEFQALITAIEGEQLLLPWWAYALIMVGVIGIALLVAYFAWKKGNWVTLLVAALVGSSTIAALESFLYGEPVLGGYMVLASVGALALFLIARWVKRTVVDPVAKRLNDAVEAVQGVRKGVSDYVGSMTVKGARDAVVGAAGAAASATVEVARGTVDAAAEAGKKAADAAAEAARATATAEAGTAAGITALGKELEDKLNVDNLIPKKPTIDGQGLTKGGSTTGLFGFGGGDFVPDMTGYETPEQKQERENAEWAKRAYKK
jgi:hypothetical protein